MSGLVAGPRGPREDTERPEYAGEILVALVCRTWSSWEIIMMHTQTQLLVRACLPPQRLLRRIGRIGGRSSFRTLLLGVFVLELRPIPLVPHLIFVMVCYLSAFYFQQGMCSRSSDFRSEITEEESRRHMP